MHQYLANTDLASAELKYVAELLATWRERLSDLSCPVAKNNSDCS